MDNIQLRFQLIYKYVALELIPKTLNFLKIFTVLISTALSESSCNNTYTYIDMPKTLIEPRIYALSQ